MGEIKDRWARLPKSVRVSEVITLITFVIFILSVIGGGSFTSFYALMLFCISAMITSGICFVKKAWLLAILNILILVLCFVTYIYNA